MPAYAVIALSEVPAQGTVAHGAFVYRSSNVADQAAAVAEFSDAQDLPYPVKVWAIPVGQLTPFRIDVARQKSVVAE